jgi:hypothetical protein
MALATDNNYFKSSTIGSFSSLTLVTALIFDNNQITLGRDKFQIKLLYEYSLMSFEQR